MDTGAALFVTTQDPQQAEGYNITEMIIEAIVSTVAPNATKSTR